MTRILEHRGSDEGTISVAGADQGTDRLGMPWLFDLRVLLIEDDREVALTLQRFLLRSGIQVALAHSGAEAVAMKSTFSPHVILVDLQLPDIDGETLIRWLIAQHDCGIIVVSGNGDEASRVLILELGADDYVIKPPNFRVLLARIRAVYRRSCDRMAPQISEARQPNVRLGDFTVDLQTRQIRDRMAKPVKVTAAEFAVVVALIEAKGTPVSREQLSQVAPRRPWHSEDRSVDQLVFGLRKKLSTAHEDSGLIQSIRNAGYVLAMPDIPGP